ncbi:ABC transporter ATP-binding protein [Terribacillus sp. 7520-G]|uniref:ABC transporter ATP-binding protein n=1 Tax=Terribacillus TaxID=459532 RepID=UPI000BA7C950|nr:ABC transporter ATP-binding protein [Terribacillus sp. 7520-G]PAD38426.1 ABC transporter ATP-binding protein [Terribacillus sp. 7520-G]
MRITLQGIEKRFGSVQAVGRTDLTITDQFVTILGQSGCGKTTLLKMLAGLTDPTAGELRFDDQVIFSSEASINIKPSKRGIAMVFQDFGLWPHMSVFDNIAFGLRGKHSKAERCEIVMDALQKVQLEDKAKRKPGELSGGQQQRVALARAIAVNPRLILFDEALSALDSILREQMREEILSIIQTIHSQAIFVTHDQTEAMAMSDCMIIMEAGKVIQKGPPEQIYHAPNDAYVANLIGRANWTADKDLIRPEAIHLQPHAAQKARTGIVRKSLFEGDRYIIHAEVDGQLWQFYDSRPHEARSIVKLYVQEDAVHPLYKQEV